MGRTAVVLFLAGLGCLLVGMLFKVQHWPVAGVMLSLSACALAIGVVLFAVALIKNKGLTGALDPASREEKPR